MIALPFFHRPSRLVFLDDDPIFIDILSLAIAKNWHADFFIQAQTCLQFLQANAKAWADDFWLQRQLMGEVQAGASVIPLVLRYWRNHPERFALVQLATFDYAMPSMTGLEALRMLGAWEGSRVLLTGQADEAVAVKAFNEGLIDLYMLKQHSGLRAYLAEQLQPLLDKANPSQQALWGQGLSQHQQHLLLDAQTAEALQHWITTENCIEYVVTAQPFGMLGVDALGRVSWLQLELAADVADLVDLVDEDQASLSPQERASLLRGESLINAELCLALEGLPSSIRPAFQIGSSLLGAVHDLGDAYALAPDQSYAGWCSKNPSRIVSD
jgi:CheY-like chemotaxis protein